MIANIGDGKYGIIIGNTYEPCVSKVTQVSERLIQVRSIDTEDERVYGNSLGVILLARVRAS